LPWLLRRLLPAKDAARAAALRTPFLQELEDLPAARRASVARPGLLWLAACAWVLLAAAAARPQWLGEPIELAMSGRDLMLAVDLSGSMGIRDFKLNGREVDRLAAVKAVAGRFIERRSGDRIGLILFGTNAFLQAPLTFDRTTAHTLLKEAFTCEPENICQMNQQDERCICMAGPSTAIGDAIGLAVKRLRDNPENQRVLILLSDGANTAGAMQPLQAAELAAKEKLKIYTIGVGADEMIVPDLFGSRRVNPSADMDEETMTAIATKTGGRYFRARDTAELEKIYRLLDELEPVERDKRYYRPKTELFPWPLGLALALATALVLVRPRV